MSLLRVNQINFFCQYLSINLVARSCGKSLQFRIELHPHPFKVFAFPSTNNHILVTEKCLVPIPWGHCVKQIIVMLSPQQSLIHMVHLGFMVSMLDTIYCQTHIWSQQMISLESREPKSIKSIYVLSHLWPKVWQTKSEAMCSLQKEHMNAPNSEGILEPSSFDKPMSPSIEQFSNPNPPLNKRFTHW